MTVETIEVHRHRTAMTRYALSVPMQALGRHGYLDGNWSVFDYGCGKGGDLAILAKNGVVAAGWDPHYRPDAPMSAAQIVNLGFVLNVIEDREERLDALQNAYALTDTVLSVSVMLSSTGGGNGNRFGDGVLTTRNTFQKYFSQEEFREYLIAVLDEAPVAVGPGLFFVFKDKDEEQRFLAQRQQNRRGLDRLIQRIPKPTREEREQAFYEEQREHLDSIWEMWLTFGRAPQESELSKSTEVRNIFGSLAKALGFLKRFHGDEATQLAASSRQDDLRVFLALLEFEHRSAYRSFPEDLRRDIRALFGSLQRAKDEAHELLFSAGETDAIESACQDAVDNGLGWLDQKMALTVHTSLVEQLPALLRVYIGCASKLYGDVTSADLLKVHTRSAKLTLMSFESFEKSSLPLMTQRTKVDLRAQRIDVFDYGGEYEHPYLYWKSRYLVDDFPKYKSQRKFDEALAATGLVGDELHGPLPAELDDRMKRACLVINGFRIKPTQAAPSLDESCGQYLTFRQLLVGLDAADGESALEPWVFASLSKLVARVLDPLMDYFGGIEVHMCHWSASTGPYFVKACDEICEAEKDALVSSVRGQRSVAIGFIIADESMLEVATWLSENTSFHRLVVRGDADMLVVSAGTNDRGEVSARSTRSSRRAQWVSQTEWLATEPVADETEEYRIGSDIQ